MPLVLLFACRHVGSWTLLPTEGAPEARGAATAVSTGDGVFVFGGWRGADDVGCIVGGSSLLDGGLYDLAVGTWSPVAALPVRSAYTYSPAVAWIADAAAVLLPPGSADDAEGVWLWHRADNRWEELGWAPIEGTPYASYEPGSQVLLASDDELLWYSGGSGQAWRIGEGERMLAPFGRAATKVVGVWTGSEALWVATDTASTSPGVGDEWAGAYDPGADSWRELAAPDALGPAARALWGDDTLWIVDSTDIDGEIARVVRRYDPDADAWVVSEPAPEVPEEPVIAWERGGVLLRGGAQPIVDGHAPPGVYWDGAEGSWTRTTDAGAPPALAGSAGVSTSEGVFVFGGGSICESSSAEGGIFRR